MNSFKRTKIVATVGPACANKTTLKKMIQAGVDVFRFNMSHGVHDDLRKVYQYIKEINRELHVHTAVLADLQGPKIRTGEMEENTILKRGKPINIVTKNIIGNYTEFSINYSKLPQEVKKGDMILMDDGKLSVKVESTNKKDRIECKVVQGGILKSRKGVNFPNTPISMPCLTPKDKKDLEFALELNVEWIALSFVRTHEDIEELRRIINRRKKKARIIAKIEKPEAIDDIDNIIHSTDAIMVARGDLGIEVPYQDVPILQKMMIKKCLKAAKPIIVATQMMESMIENTQPSRADVNDVANSVMDGTDAVMLSGETSVGKHPVKVIETMSNIIHKVEQFEDIFNPQFLPVFNEDRVLTDSICENAVQLADKVNAKAIITMTHSGYSAMKVASFRPRARIFVFTNNHSILNTVNLIWGVTGYYYDKFVSTDNTINDLKALLKDSKKVKDDDLVINITSMPIENKGKTNTIKLSYINPKLN